MSFAVRNLSVLAYAQGFTLWHYRGGAASLADLALPGFFDQAQDMLAPGDHIHVSCADGGALLLVSKTRLGVVAETMAAKEVVSDEAVSR